MRSEGVLEDREHTKQKPAKGGRENRVGKWIGCSKL